jgi:hypothetical protein
MFSLKMTEAKPKKEDFFVVLPNEKMGTFPVPFAVKDTQ